MKPLHFCSYLSSSVCLITAAVFPSSQAHAVVLDSTFHECLNCTEERILNNAQAYGNGEHYIYDLPSNLIHLVRVDSCESKFNGPVTCDNRELPIPSDVASLFNTYHAAWGMNFQRESFSSDVNYNMPSGNPVGGDHLPQDNGFVNSFDTIVGSSYQNNLTDWLEQPTHYSGAMATVISNLDTLPNVSIVNFSNMVIEVTVHFNDGSKRTFAAKDGSKVFKPVLGSARDAHNNTLKDSVTTPPAGTLYFFHGSGNDSSYDERNVIQLLPGSPPPLPASGCLEVRWNGHAVTCILPK